MPSFDLRVRYRVLGCASLCVRLRRVRACDRIVSAACGTCAPVACCLCFFLFSVNKIGTHSALADWRIG